MIIDEGSHVRIAEFGSPQGSQPVREFTVPRDRYLAARAALMAQSNPIVSPDHEDHGEESH